MTIDNNGRWESNPINFPEVHGLELFETLDTAGSYEFCTTAVLKRPQDGTLFYAQDSGCRCPTPFEYTTELYDITKDSYGEFKLSVQDFHKHDVEHDLDAKQKLLAFLEKIKNYLW